MMWRSTRKASPLQEDKDENQQDPGAGNSAAALLRTRFSDIQRERPFAIDLLSFMSFFDPLSIPLWVLQNYVCRRHKGEAGIHGIGGDRRDSEHDRNAEFEDDLKVLQRYYLVSVNTHLSICEMPGPVQLHMRGWPSGEEERWESTFLRNMSLEYPYGNYENWGKCQQLERHIAKVVEEEPTNENAEYWALLLANAAWHRWQTGQHVVAENMTKRLLNVRERTLGSEHPHTLASVNNLAVMLSRQGKYEEAEQMNRRALIGSEKQLGQEHLSTLTSLSNLALVLSQQAKYEEAEQLIRRALDSRNTQLGAEHPDTLTSVSNLALVLSQQGKDEEAELMDRWALNSRTRFLGEEHPDTPTSYSNLAMLLGRQGKYKEAEQMHRWTLHSRQKQFGAEHPDTLISVSCLAYILRQNRQLTDANDLYQRAYNSYIEVLGPGHPTTIACRVSAGA